MAKFINMRMLGFKELDKALSEIPKAMSRDVLLKALKRAAEPALSQGEANAPMGATLGIVNSFGARAMKRRRYGAEIAVGPNAPHAHLIEFGTKPHVTVIENKGVLSDGTHVYGVRVENKGVTPNRFWTRAWESTRNEVLSELQRYIWAELKKAAKRLGGQAARGRLSSEGKDSLR